MASFRLPVPVELVHRQVPSKWILNFTKSFAGSVYGFD
jgi:hypothetical protein